MNSKDDLIFIEHILDSIRAIESFGKSISKNELEINRMKQSAVVREIEVIGEAVKNISHALKNKHKQIPWKDIIGTKDKMIHHYFGIDFDIVLSIVNENLPVLKSQLEKIKRELTNF